MKMILLDLVDPRSRRPIITTTLLGVLLLRNLTLTIIIRSICCSLGLCSRLLLLNKLVLDHPFDMLRVVLGDIRDALISRPNKAFKGQVVARRQRVVLIGFNQTTCIFSRTIVERILFKYDLKLTEIDRDRVLTDYDTWVVFDILDLTEPSVGTDVPSCEALRGVCVEDSLHEIAAVIADKLRDRVVCVQDLLVEHVCLRVLEGQITADHSVENNAARPDIGW